MRHAELTVPHFEKPPHAIKKPLNAMNRPPTARMTGRQAQALRDLAASALADFPVPVVTVETDSEDGDTTNFHADVADLGSYPLGMDFQWEVKIGEAAFVPFVPDEVSGGHWFFHLLTLTGGDIRVTATGDGIHGQPTPKLSEVVNVGFGP